MHREVIWLCVMDVHKRQDFSVLLLFLLNYVVIMHQAGSESLKLGLLWVVWMSSPYYNYSIYITFFDAFDSLCSIYARLLVVCMC